MKISLIAASSIVMVEYTFFFYKKVVYKKVGLQRPKNKKVKGYNTPTLRKFLNAILKKIKVIKNLF